MQLTWLIAFENLGSVICFPRFESSKGGGPIKFGSPRPGQVLRPGNVPWLWAGSKNCVELPSNLSRRWWRWLSMRSQLHTRRSQVREAKEISGSHAGVIESNVLGQGCILHWIGINHTRSDAIADVVLLFSSWPRKDGGRDINRRHLGIDGRRVQEHRLTVSLIDLLAMWLLDSQTKIVLDQSLQRANSLLQCGNVVPGTVPSSP